MKKAIRIFLGLAAFLALALAGALITYQSKYGSPVISISNKTNAVLHDIRIFDTHWEHKIERLDAGSEMDFVQHVGGESGLAVSFNANGKTYMKKDLDYFEESGGYCVGIVILPDYSIHSESRIGCPKRKRAS